VASGSRRCGRWRREEEGRGGKRRERQAVDTGVGVIDVACVQVRTPLPSVEASSRRRGLGVVGVASSRFERLSRRSRRPPVTVSL
jgi:hypothetical protein